MLEAFRSNSVQKEPELLHWCLWLLQLISISVLMLPLKV